MEERTVGDRLADGVAVGCLVMLADIVVLTVSLALAASGLPFGVGYIGAMIVVALWVGVVIKRRSSRRAQDASKTEGEDGSRDGV